MLLGRNALGIDWDELDDLLRLMDYYESCAVQGHIPIKSWASNETGLEPPPGVPVTCQRCGAALEDA